MPKVIKRGPGDPSPIAPSTQNHRPAPVAPSTIGTGVRPPAKDKVIPREHVDANIEARRIRQEAELEAQRIREEAEAAAEATREQGYQDGYQEGLGAYTEQTTKALLELQQKEQALEAEFIKLVRICVEKVLGQEIKLNPDAVTGIVRNALRDARQQREIIVRVHPEDAENVRKNQRRLLEMLARANTIEVRDDPSVTRGGCIVVTELGTIDASLERQLGAIEKALEEAALEGPPPDGDYPAGDEEIDQEDDPGYGGNY